MRDCIKRIVEKSNNVIPKEVAREILKQVERDAVRRTRAGFEFDDAVSQVIKEAKQNIIENVEKQKANIARNVVIKARTVDKISQHIDAGLSIVDAFRADLEGINSPIEGVRDSLDIQKSAVESAYFSKLIGQLNRENLLEILNSKAFDDEIGRELWAMSKGEKNATQNQQAARIAQIIYDTRENMRQRLNQAGADIQQVAGYVMPQRHDTYAMFKDGEDKWVNFMRPLVDEERSFNGDYDNINEALRGAYRAMVTGIRLNDPQIKQAKLFQFTGPANLGKKLSQSRIIHFKDYDSWRTWNLEYGSKDINEGVLDAIRFDSSSIALLERYGTNPEAMLEAVASDVKKKYRDQAAKTGELGIDTKIKDMINFAVEKDMISANPNLARYGSNIRAFNNVTLLGSALLSGISDVGLKALEYQHQGKTWLSSTVQPFLDISQGFKSKRERIEFASLTGVGMESMIADIGARFSTQDTLTNKAAKVQRMFFKLNGLSWWTDSHKNAMGRVMSHHLGLKRASVFDALDADTQRLFGNYNITKEDWDIARAAATKLDDGRYYVLPELIDNQKIKEKFIGYYADRANFGVITPTGRERRIATFGTQRGTAVGEAWRLMMQFKSFPITVLTKVWGRGLYAKGKMDVPAMAYLLLTSMAFGYIAQAAKDLTKGRSPKDPRKLETVYASLVQGGGAGILGDILLQDSSGFGRSATSTLVGPTFGKIDEIFKIYSAGIRGGGSAATAVRTGASLVPGNNLFYVRPALDNLLLLPIQEELNPGYIRRMERNMKKTYGQELLSH